MGEFITDKSFVETAMMLMYDFETTIYENSEFGFQAGVSTLQTEPREYILTASDSPETMCKDFVTSLDREELEFLSCLSGCSEYPSALSFQEIHFQMTPTLNMTDSATGCSPTELEHCDSPTGKEGTAEQGK